MKLKNRIVGSGEENPQDILANPLNFRGHPTNQRRALSGAMRELGWIQQVIINKTTGHLIDGHLRVEMAVDESEPTVPVLYVELSEKEEKIALASLDPIAALAEEDDSILQDLLKQVGDVEDADLAEFLDSLLAEPEIIEGLTDEDAVPEAPEKPVTVLGDVWILGDHRLMCGDSTSTDDVNTLMAGHKADYCFSSPPYGQQRNYKNVISNWDEMMNGVYSILPVKDGAQVLVNLGLIHSEKEWQPYWDKWIDYMRDCGWLRFALYVWDQGAGMMGDHHGRLAPSFELIFHFCKESKKAQKTAKSKLAGQKTSSKGQRAASGEIKKRSGAGKPIQETKVRDSVIRVNRQLSIAKAGGHPAPFPVELCKELSDPWIKRGDICYEPFAGSGTQIINCEKEGYLFYGMELAPEYADIAVIRWQDFTGKTAVLESTGEPFESVSNREPLEGNTIEA